MLVVYSYILCLNENLKKNLYNTIKSNRVKKLDNLILFFLHLSDINECNLNF